MNKKKSHYFINRIKFMGKVIFCALLLSVIMLVLEVIYDKNEMDIYLAITEDSLLLLLGIIFCLISIIYIKKKANTNEDQDNNIFIGLSIGTVGLSFVIIMIFRIIHNIMSLWKLWGYKGSSAITGVSIIVSVITLVTGSLIKLKINNDNNIKDKSIGLHKEVNWRKQLQELEIQDGYIIRDLVKLNSFINPKHNVVENDNIDVQLNKKIVEILTSHGILFNESKNNKKNEPNKTLFDAILYKSDFDKKLTAEENQIIREYIHDLLKIDWEIQIK